MNNDKHINKLLSAGFTEEQAKAIIEIIETKTLSGGFL